jgi:hypothetical protein
VSQLDRGEHLPQKRPGGAAAHPSWLPRHRNGVSPQMIGRYPDYDVLKTVDTWDAVTREVVLARLSPPDHLSFITAEQEPTFRAFCDVVLAQYEDPRVPVPEMVDKRLAESQFDGYQYADMPDDRETWRLVLAGLDETARATGGAPFAELSRADREQVVGLLADGKVAGGSWDRLNVKRAWSVVMRYCLAAFYSHPWAWNEIGFGGPAYPRGFMRLGPTAVREPFETEGAVDIDPMRDIDHTQERG